MPEITALITTYFPPGDGYLKRLDALEETLASWNIHLDYAGKVGFHIADDGSEQSFMTLQERVQLAFEHNPIFSGNVSSSWQNRAGLGASLNAGLRIAFTRSPLVFHAVDDWALDDRMDLTPWAETLMEPAFNLGLMRLGPPHAGTTGEVFMCAGGWMLRLEPHNFAFATRPFLMHQKFYDHYGPFQEQTSALEMERLYNEHFCRDYRKGGGHGIALSLPHPWRHIDTIELSSLAPVAR